MKEDSLFSAKWFNGEVFIALKITWDLKKKESVGYIFHRILLCNKKQKKKKGVTVSFETKWLELEVDIFSEISKKVKDNC